MTPLCLRSDFTLYLCLSAHFIFALVSHGEVEACNQGWISFLFFNFQRKQELLTENSWKKRRNGPLDFSAIFCSKRLFSIHNHSILQKNINRWTFLLTLARLQHSVCEASFKKGKQLSSNYQYFNVYFPRVSSFPPQCAQFSSCFSTFFLLSQRELLREGSNLRLTTFVPALISIVNFTLEWTHWASGDREHRGNIQETSPAPDPPSPPPRDEAKSW